MASLSKLIQECKDYLNPHVLTLTHEQEIVKEECEGSFHDFVRHAWPHVQGKSFKDGFHIEAITEHMEALYDLEIRDLLINLPPRCGKSLITSVFYPAWIWTIEPNISFLYTAYSSILSERDSRFCKRLIASEWYQSLWADKYKIMKDSNSVARFDNNKHGFRIASSVEGTITGQGADILCVDDPNSIQNVDSKVTRDSINEWWDYVMSTRFSNAATARRLVVQQRAHMQDLSGHILNKVDSGWVHLCLPLEYNPKRRCVTVPLLGAEKPWEDWRKKEGELLWPAGMPLEEVDKMKANFNHDSYMIAAQFQQWPSPAEGSIYKEDWFQEWTDKDLPDFEWILMSWDTALTSGKNSCFSAMTCWGIFDKKGIKNVMLLSALQIKEEYPNLRKIAVRLAHNYTDIDYDDPDPGKCAYLSWKARSNMILIEGKVNGHSLFQDLLDAGLDEATLFHPNRYGNKVFRARTIAHLVENGRVYLQRPAHGELTESSEILKYAAINYPKDEEGADIIDSMSQALIRLKSDGWLRNTEDPRIIMDPLSKGVDFSYDGLPRR